MKKVLVTLLVMTMVITGLLAGCGGSGSSDSGSGDSGSSDSGSKKLKIGYTVCEKDQFQVNVITAAEKKAKELGIELNIQDAQKDVQKQIDQIQTFASQGMDAIVVVPQEPDTAEALVAAAGDTPVVFVNRQPKEDILVANKVVCVNSDEAQAGELQAEFIANELFKDKKDLNYALLQGILGNASVLLRSDGALDGLKAEGYTLTEQFKDTAEWDRAKAMQLIQTFLGTGKPVDVIISNNDEMALGALEALKAVGKTTADVPVVGLDGTVEACQSILDGGLNASVYQDAIGQGEGAIQAAQDLVDGKDVDTHVIIPFVLITKENAQEFIDLQK
ncbi:MAG: substrate-binding domain-containing protein [Clostridiales Family XIII bacterium]|jgi:inositol transport system substrate-binding protein|nr:substrate-binding domain-containing protein [Clostridiales Family XIII bacterium]